MDHTAGSTGNGPALRVPPVELTAGQPGAVPPTSTLSRRVLVAAMLLGIPGLVLCVVAVTAAIALRLGDGTGDLYVLAAAAAVMALCVTAFVRLVRPERTKQLQVVLEPSDEPELHDVVAGLARAVGAPCPHRIAIVARTDLRITAPDGLAARMARRRTLIVGSPLLDTLTVTELQALICWELAHLDGDGHRMGPLVSRSGLSGAELGRSARGVTRVVFGWYLARLDRIETPIRQHQDVVADRAAAGVVGTQHLADALWRAELTARLMGRFVRDTVVPVVRAGALPPVAPGFAAYVQEPGRVAAFLDEPAERPDAWPWPPFAERLAHLASLGAATGTPSGPGSIPANDPRAAASMLREAPRWQQAANRALFDDLARTVLPEIEWSDTPALVGVPLINEEAMRVDDALASLGHPPGRTGFAAAVRSDRIALAEALIVRGWKRPGEPLESTLEHACRSVTGRDVLQAGGSLQFSWSGVPRLFDPDGVRVDVAAAAAALLADAPTEPGPPTEPAQLTPPPSHPLAPRGIPATAPESPASTPTGSSADGDTRTFTLEDHPDDLPVAPMPPFERAPGGYRIRMRRKVVGTTELTVTSDGIAVGDRHVAYADVEHVRLVRVSEELRFHLVTEHGTVRITDSTAGPSDRGRSLAEFDYLWGVCQTRIFPRLAERALAELQGGRLVTIGSLRMSDKGVSAQRGPTVRWSDVGDLRVPNRRRVEVPLGGALHPMSLDADDVLVLRTLLSSARRTFG